MIKIGSLHPTEGIPLPSDTVQTMLIAASSGQAMDWSSTMAQMVRLSMVSTAGAAVSAYVSLNSTRAAAPSSGTATGTTGGSLPSIPIPPEGRVLQIPGGSTGWSVASLSSGYVFAEVWGK